MNKCGCVGLRVNNDSVIKYCPLHEAAPALLAACEALIEWESVASKAEEMRPDDHLYNVAVLQSGIKLNKAVRLASAAISAVKEKENDPYLARYDYAGDMREE